MYVHVYVRENVYMYTKVFVEIPIILEKETKFSHVDQRPTHLDKRSCPTPFSVVCENKRLGSQRRKIVCLK